MIRLLRSGKFWLKFISFGTFAVLMILFSLYIALHQLFSVERMHALADAVTEGTGRSIRFSSNIGRSWLPRPTATLYNVVITKPGHATAAVMVKEMRIGLAWNSLWGKQPEIEKWQLQQAEVELLRDTDGRWSLQDLWEKPGSQPLIGHITVSNSRINTHLPDRSYFLHNFNADIQSPDNDIRTFSGSGSFSGNRFDPFDWKAEGTFIRNQQAWQMPQLHVQADTVQQTQQISLSANTSLSWQPKQHILTAKNTRLRADSPFYDLHLSMESPLLNWHGDRLEINRINGVYTAASEKARWNGSFMFAKAALHPQAASIDEFQANNNLQTDRHHTTANLTGKAVWQQAKGLNINNLKLSILQDSLNGSTQSRFNTQLSGSFSLKDSRHWKTGLQGTFDRQPASIEAVYTREGEQQGKLSSNISLRRLVLSPYWEMLQSSSGNTYPLWLSRSWAPEIESQISIGSVSMPDLQLDSLDTRLIANRSHITLSNFRAELYEGHTEGGLSIANTNPPAYHLQQNAVGIQVRPLLQDLFQHDNISGEGQAVIDFTAQGYTRADLTRSLNGSLQLMVSNGAWIGFDLHNILRRVSRNNPYPGGIRNQNVQTPFNRFSIFSMIKDGVGYHENLELVSNLLRINSTGGTNFNTQTLSENILIYNLRNPQAKPIPLKIRGPINNPSVTIDFPRLTYGLTTSEEKRRALAETLRDQWQWLNQRYTP